jgi:hypothetical protein
MRGEANAARLTLQYGMVSGMYCGMYYKLT